MTTTATIIANLQAEVAELQEKLAAAQAGITNLREECADVVRFADNGTEAAEIIRAMPLVIDTKVAP